MTTIESPEVYVTDDTAPREPERAIVSGKRYATLVFSGKTVRIPLHRIDKIVSSS